MNRHERHAAAVHAMHPPWWKRILIWLLGRRIEIANERGATVYREWRGVTYLWSYRDE